MSDDSYDFLPTPRRVLTDDVVDSIRGAILAGRIKPGARLIEEDLAVSLKVSRGPVRQAIFRLQQEGLVVHEPHRGATVRQISEEDVAEIYSLRLALERLAIEQAIRKAGSAELAEIEAILRRFDATPRAAITRRLVAELDIDFHDAIFRAAGSWRLYRAWEMLRSQLMMFLMLRDALPADYLDMLASAIIAALSEVDSSAQQAPHRPAGHRGAHQRRQGAPARDSAGRLARAVDILSVYPP